MIGVDLVFISKFLGKESKFAKRILSSQEYQQFLTTKNQTKFIATRWALKEAIFKINNQVSDFSKIDIVKFKHQYQFQNYSLSTSDQDGLLIAVAINLATKE